jgi:hypothetical protein
MGRARIVRSFGRPLEHEPHVQLDQAAGTGSANISKMTFCIGLPVVDHTRGITKERATAIVHGAPLRVIESIERICAELELLAFAERFKSLLQSHIPVVNSGLANVIPMFVTPSDCEVCDALIEVERVSRC